MLKFGTLFAQAEARSRLEQRPSKQRTLMNKKLTILAIALGLLASPSFAEDETCEFQASAPSAEFQAEKNAPQISDSESKDLQQLRYKQQKIRSEKLTQIREHSKIGFVHDVKTERKTGNFDWEQIRFRNEWKNMRDENRMTPKNGKDNINVEQKEQLKNQRMEQRRPLMATPWENKFS